MTATYQCIICDTSKPAAKGKLKTVGGKKVHSDSIPKGWSRRNGNNVICNKCRDRTSRIRAVTLPVMGVVDFLDDPFAEGKKRADPEKAITPENMQKRFLECLTGTYRGEDDGPRMNNRDGVWHMSTGLANWAVRKLLERDTQMLPNTDSACPGPPVMNLAATYKAEGHPLGKCATRTIGNIFRAVQSKYKDDRLHAVWLGKKSLPLFRFPYPYPIDSDSWHTGYMEVPLDHVGKKRAAEGKGPATKLVPTITLRFHESDTGPRWVLQLPSGQKHWGRHLADFRAIHQGNAPKRQMQLLAKPCAPDDPGVVVIFRETSGGQRIPCRLMVKLVADFPRKTDHGARTEVMYLRTDPQAFWTAAIDGREMRPFILNGDHITRSLWMMKRRHEQHHAWLQRVSEDMKYEKRWPLRVRRQTNDAYQKVCDKHRRRIDTWIKQMVAQTVNFAIRRGVGRIVYDDQNRQWTDSFPWHKLKTLLKQACDARGVHYTDDKTGEEAKTT